MKRVGFQCLTQIYIKYCRVLRLKPVTHLSTISAILPRKKENVVYFKHLLLIGDEDVHPAGGDRHHISATPLDQQVAAKYSSSPSSLPPWLLESISHAAGTVFVAFSLKHCHSWSVCYWGRYSGFWGFCTQCWAACNSNSRKLELVKLMRLVFSIGSDMKGP